MKHFFIALQFLTRIHISSQASMTSSDFCQSVAWFPLVGAVLGGVLFFSALSLQALFPGTFFLAAAPVILLIGLTGGLHCDGFMDTMDGLLSGRSRVRALEIMKDSRTGAMGVTFFVCVLLLWFSLLRDLSVMPVYPYALFLLPFAGRYALVLSIYFFPYARPQGLGKMFKEGLTKRIVFQATGLSIPIVLCLGSEAVLVFLLSLLSGMLFARRISAQLGGLTGDVYGAVVAVSETTVLLLYFLFTYLNLKG